MSPVSRGRRKPQKKLEPTPPRNSPRVWTPRLSLGAIGGEMQRFGVRPPAESLLVSAFLNMWQYAMTRQPANTCILGCAALQEALTEFGITSQMVTVYAEVDHDDGLAPTPVGVPSAPGRGDTGQWTGHLALWLPTMRRFVDPTIYQASRPGRGRTIVMGIVTQLPSLQAIENVTVRHEVARVE